MPSRKKTNVKIRIAQHQDVQEIVQVEKETWPDGLGAEAEKFHARIGTFPEGVIVAEVAGKIVGVVVGEIIDYDFSNPQNRTWYDLTDNGYIKNSHNPNGNVVFGVDLSVVPTMQNQGIATKLLEEIGKMVVRRNLVCGMLGGRIPGYHKYSAEMSAEEYINKKTPNGDYFDSEVNFYSGAGLKIIKLIPEYFKDPESLNYGVLIMWKNPYYQKNKTIGRLFGKAISFFFRAPR